MEENKKLNTALGDLYQNNTSALLEEWRSAFPGECAPNRVNEFGIIDPARYDRERAILFVCRETNGWDNEDYEKGILFRPWMEEISRHGLEGRGHISRHPNLWYQLARWTLLIQEPERDPAALARLKTVAPLGSVAFTNINKIRGKSRSGKEYLRLANSPVTQEVLREEICLLRPKYLVCGGTYELLSSLLPENFEGRLLRMPHPGCRKGSEAMLRQLKAQLWNKVS